MVVDQVALLLAEVLLGHKSRDSQLVDDLHDVELGVESSSRLRLQLVFVVVVLAAAEAPRARQVLLPAEAPDRVVELLALFHLVRKVLLEVCLVLGRVQRVVMLFLVLLFLHIVVELLGHRVVEGEALVGSEHVADETQAQGQVGSEALESVRDGLAGRACRDGLRVLREVHREVGVLGVDGGGIRWLLIFSQRVDRVERAGDIVGFVLGTWVQLGHVGHIDPAIVSESDGVFLQ